MLRHLTGIIEQTLFPLKCPDGSAPRHLATLAVCDQLSLRGVATYANTNTTDVSGLTGYRVHSVYLQVAVVRFSLGHLH